MPPETWYVHPNDLIGGWSVMNRDHPPSGLNRVAEPDAREVAAFMSEQDARRIADLHNADAMFVCESCPDDGWGCCGSWNDGTDRRAFVAGRRRERERLAAAGRLLPEGGETRTEWGVWWHRGDSDGIALDEQQFSSRARAEERGRQRIGDYGTTRFTIHHRDHRIFDDGSSFTGPWVEEVQIPDWAKRSPALRGNDGAIWVRSEPSASGLIGWYRDGIGIAKPWEIVSRYAPQPTAPAGPWVEVTDA